MAVYEVRGDEVRVKDEGAYQLVREPESYQIIAPQAVQDAFRGLIHLADGSGTKAEIRTAISVLEQELLLMPQVEPDLVHRFTDGLYVRVGWYPRGTLMSSYTYLEECVMTTLQGRMVMVTEDGITGIVPPHYVLTPKGGKRVLVTVEDTIVLTVHPNPSNEKDIAVLERRIYKEVV